MTDDTAQKQQPEHRAPKGDAPISSRDLFGQAQEVVIDHEGSLYRLRITRQGKLILNK